GVGPKRPPPGPDEEEEPHRGEADPPDQRAPGDLTRDARYVPAGPRHVVPAGQRHGQIASAAFLTANVASPTNAASQIAMMLTGIPETVPWRVTSVPICTIR